MGTDRPRVPRRTAVVVVVRAWAHEDGVAARLVLDSGRARQARSVVVGSLDELCAVLGRELTAALRPDEQDGTAPHGP